MIIFKRLKLKFENIKFLNVKLKSIFQIVNNRLTLNKYNQKTIKK
jgi:hypothetical protein